MEDETSRGYPLVAEREADKAESVNAGFRAIDADVASVAAAVATADAKAQSALDNGGGSGNGGATETNVVIPANRIEWTDTGITLDNEVLILEALGQISHGAGITPYGAYNQGGAYLVWLLVTDGSTPVDNAPGKIDYRVLRTAHKKSGRLWLHIRDAGGAGDNTGSFTVKVRRWANLVSVLAPLSELAGLRDALTLETTARAQADAALQVAISALPRTEILIASLDVAPHPTNQGRYEETMNVAFTMPANSKNLRIEGSFFINSDFNYAAVTGLYLIVNDEFNASAQTVRGDGFIGQVNDGTIITVIGDGTKEAIYFNATILNANSATEKIKPISVRGISNRGILPNGLLLIQDTAQSVYFLRFQEGFGRYIHGTLRVYATL